MGGTGYGGTQATGPPAEGWANVGAGHAVASAVPFGDPAWPREVWAHRYCSPWAVAAMSTALL